MYIVIHDKTRVNDAHYDMMERIRDLQLSFYIVYIIILCVIKWEFTRLLYEAKTIDAITKDHTRA